MNVFHVRGTNEESEVVLVMTQGETTKTTDISEEFIGYIDMQEFSSGFMEPC